MAVIGKFETWTIAAGEDLDDLTPTTGQIWKAIALDDGKIAVNGNEAGGILQYGAKSGEHITLGIRGVMKFAAAAAVTAGKKLTVNASGYMITAGSGTYIVGRNLDTAVASGAVGTGHFDFAAARYMGDSGEAA